MVADTFNNSGCTGISYAETLAGNTVDKCFSACCSVKGYITDYDIFLRFELASLSRVDDKLTAGKTFAEVVIAVAFKLHCKSFGNESTEALATAAVALDCKHIVLKRVGVKLCNL